MPHSVQCPKCANQLKLLDVEPGMLIRCPGCQAGFRIAQPSNSRMPTPGVRVVRLALVDRVARPSNSRMPSAMPSETPTQNSGVLSSVTPDSGSDQLTLADKMHQLPRPKIAWAPIVLSGVASVVAITALVVALNRDPLGKGIGSYDFSTPEASAKSMIQIEASRDIRAKLDLEMLRDGADFKDAIRTFEISKVENFSDQKVVFASYLERGNKKRRLFGFEKDLESKKWLPKFISSYDVQKNES